jgi:protein phosphatase
VVLEDRGVLALADGVGGHPGGSLAARLAVGTVREMIGTEAAAGDAIDTEERTCWCCTEGSPDPERVQRVLSGTFELANMEVRHSALESGRVGMCASLLVAWALPDDVWIAHVGDSRAFLFRDGRMRRLTTDHVVRDSGADRGGPGHRGRLTRAIGLGDGVKPELRHESVLAGDAVVLATDGLYDVLSVEEMAQAMSQVRSPDAAVHCLLWWALERGGWDDITVAIGVWGGMWPR